MLVCADAGLPRAAASGYAICKVRVALPMPQTTYVSAANEYAYQPPSSLRLVGRASWPAYRSTSARRRPGASSLSLSLLLGGLMSPSVEERSSSASKDEV